MHHLGPTLASWRASWSELKTKNPDPRLPLSSGEMKPLGYIVMQPGMRDHRPWNAYQRWIQRFPTAYRRDVLHYRSLMPMAMEARKPVFFLKPADGAIGAHVEAARVSYQDFLLLAIRIGEQCGIDVR